MQHGQSLSLKIGRNWLQPTCSHRLLFNGAMSRSYAKLTRIKFIQTVSIRFNFTSLILILELCPSKIRKNG